MSKFNVGDRVRSLVDEFDVKKGKVYPIIVLDKDGVDVLDDRNELYRLHFNEIKLVEPALTIDKVTEWLRENGYIYTLSEVTGFEHEGIIEIRNPVKEPEFEWGEEVEVRYSKHHEWEKGMYLGKCTDGHAVETKDNFCEHFYECRKPKTKVTLNEMAEWKGADKDRIDIE